MNEKRGDSVKKGESPNNCGVSPRAHRLLPGWLLLLSYFIANIVTNPNAHGELKNVCFITSGCRCNKERQNNMLLSQKTWIIIMLWVMRTDIFIHVKFVYLTNLISPHFFSVFEVETIGFYHLVSSQTFPIRKVKFWTFENHSSLSNWPI